MTRSADIAYELVAGSAVNILAEAVTIAALAAVLLVSAPPITLVAVALVLALVLAPIVVDAPIVGANRRGGADAASAAAARAAAKPRRDQGRQGHRAPGVLRGAVPPHQARAVAHQAAPLVGRRRRPARRRSHADPQHAAGRVSRHADGASSGGTVSVLALFAYTGFRVVPSANRIMLNVGVPARSAPVGRGDAAGHARPAPAGAAAVRAPAADAARHAGVRRGVVSLRRGRAARRSIGVSLAIRRGESIGIVGPTGAGKSTLVDVLLGLLTPDVGPRDGRRRAARRPRAGLAATDRLRLAGCLPAGRLAAPQHRLWHCRQPRSTKRAWHAPSPWPGWMRSWRRCRRNSKRWWAKTACGCRAASASAWRLRARSTTIRP